METANNHIKQYKTPEYTLKAIRAYHQRRREADPEGYREYNKIKMRECRARKNQKIIEEFNKI
jgi:hypothetical protein